MPCIARCCCAFPAPPTRSPSCWGAAACWCGPSWRCGYAGYEIAPDGYLCREAGRKAWTDNPPTWHVQAWALRRAWTADKTTGPTFNASVNGRRYWARYGASDLAHDRHPDLLEPQELSFAQTEARIDITRLLATAAIERDAGQRLRWLEQSGFLLRKVETYDSRYREAGQRLRMGDADRRPRPALCHAAPDHHDTPRGSGHRVDRPAAAARARVAAQHLGQVAADGRAAVADRGERARQACPAGARCGATGLGGPAHRGAAQGGRRQRQRLGRCRRRQGLQGLPGARR